MGYKNLVYADDNEKYMRASHYDVNLLMNLVPSLEKSKDIMHLQKRTLSVEIHHVYVEVITQYSDLLFRI